MAKSRAEQAAFVKPTVDILFQIDFKASGKAGVATDPESQIHHTGCFFCCILAIPQFRFKIVANKADYVHVYRVAVKNGWMDPDCLVRNPLAISKYFCNYIGHNNHYFVEVMRKVWWDSGTNTKVDPPREEHVANYQNTGSLPSQENVYYCIVDFLTNSGKAYGGHHFQLFSGIGNLLYDPSMGKVDKKYGSGYKTETLGKIIFYKHKH